MRKPTKILTVLVMLMKRNPPMSVHIKFFNVFPDNMLGTEKACLGS